MYGVVFHILLWQAYSWECVAAHYEMISLDECNSYMINGNTIEMENPGEVSQILSGITFDRNNFF